MCTSKETQTHADKHFRLYTSFVPWRSCWFLVLKRPSNIADKHFNFTPIIIIWATRWQRHWNVRAFVVWDTTITDGKSSNFSFFMNYKFHIYKCLRKVCFLTDLSQKKHQISYSDLLCSLRSLFHAYLNPTLQKRGGGGDSDPQPLFLCHVVCGFPSRSLTPNFNTLTNEQEWWHEPRRHTNKHFVLLLKLISLPWLADQAWRMWCVSKDGSLLSLN